MNGEDSFVNKIKETFFDPTDRFSRETFSITLVALLLFSSITSPLLYKLCGLFLPFILVILLALIYVGYITYAFFVLYIKRLHDLNLSGWLSLLILFPGINFFFTAYLCVKKGTPESNNYGDSLTYAGPSVLLFLCYAVLGLYAFGIGVSWFYWKKLRNIPNTGQGVQQMLNVTKGLMPEEIQQELKDNPRAMGLLFIDDQFTTPVVSITQTRMLIRGIDMGKMVKVALYDGKKLEIRFSDNTVANITKFIASDDSLSVQMAVFEIDKPLGTPAKLHEENRKLLEKMNAF